METETQLSKIVESNKIPAAVGLALIDGFTPLYKSAGELIREAATVTVTRFDQVTEMKRSAELRKQLKNVRVTANKVRESLKDEANRTGKAIQQAYNDLEAQIEPVERRLEDQEKFAERAEAKRKADLKIIRTAEMLALGVAETTAEFYRLGDIPDDAYAALLASTKLAYEAKLAAEAKAKADAIEAERKRAEEEARVREENRKLREEAEAKEAAHRAEMARQEAVRKAEAEKAAREREAIEAKAKAEREAAAIEARKAAEAAQREREALEAKARKERELAAEQLAKANAEREAAQRKIDEAKRAEQARIAAEEHARKQAALAPDIDKLRALANTLRTLVIPTCTEAGQPSMDKAESAIRKCAAYIDGIADQMQ